MDALSIIRTYLSEHALDGLIVTRRDNFSWITRGCENHVMDNTEVGVASLLITPDGVLCVADCSDAARIYEEELPFSAQCVSVPWYDSMEAEWRRQIDGKRIASDTGISGTPCVQTDLIPLRMTLDEEQKAVYRQLGADCAAILEHIIGSARPGQSEAQLAAQLAGEMAQKNIRASCILIGSDERTRKYRHPMPTDKTIENDVMMVAGAERGGLWVSMTRMVSFSPLSQEVRDRFEATQHIFAAMQCHMSPGMSYREYFAFVQELYAQYALPDEWKQHHQGGPTGYACREFVVRPDTEGAIQSEQAYAWNPTFMGTKCEETTLLTREGIEVLTKTSDWPRHAVDTPWGSFSVADILVLG